MICRDDDETERGLFGKLHPLQMYAGEPMQADNIS
uniref:Uncharacterized protein n=1 Tax=Manihot esculenta TaxID=3983 RepID=A0A2C9VU15_MANES